MKKLSLFVLLVMLILFLVCAVSYAYKLPDTGQDTCYSSTGQDETCFGTGEDGEFKINSISYENNYDGTVTDKNTGLMWQQADDGIQYNWYQANGTGHSVYNPGSVPKNVCGELNLPQNNPYNDWRLPTNKELLTIVNYFIPNTNPNPAIDTNFFPTAKAAGYWSNNVYDRDYQIGWQVNFYNGNAYEYWKDQSLYVRCVRGSQNIQSFTDNGDGTVTDNSTGLIWEQGEAGQKTWSDALYYCNNQTLAGNTSWRLPNIKELQSLASYLGGNPAIDTNYFPNAHPNYYWTSTTYRDHFDNARLVAFSNGSLSYWGKNQLLYVRCVSGGQDGSTLNRLVKLTLVGGAYFLYPAVQSAYNQATDGSVIRAQATDLTETLSFITNIAVSLRGGYNSDFTENTLKTKLTGSLIIKGGTVIIENFIIR